MTATCDRCGPLSRTNSAHDSGFVACSDHPGGRKGPDLSVHVLPDGDVVLTAGSIQFPRISRDELDRVVELVEHLRPRTPR